MASLQITVADASLGWLSPPALSGIDIRDAAGKQLATVESIRMNRSPLALVSDLNNLGEIEIERPVVYLAVRPDGTNWQDALGPLLENAKEDAGRGNEIDEWRRRRQIAVRVIDGTVLVEETATAQRWRLHARQCAVRLARRDRGDAARFCRRASSTTDGLATPTMTPASFVLALTNDQGRQQLTWQLQNIPLAAAEPWLRLASAGRGDQRRIVRTRNGDVGSHRGQSAQRLFHIRHAHIASRSTSPRRQLAGDHVRLANVELPWRLTSQPTGITIEDLQLKSDVGRFAARGTLDPAMLATASDQRFGAAQRGCPARRRSSRAKSISRRWRRCCRTCCGFAATRQITAGKLQLAGRSQPIDGGQSFSGMLRTSGLAATSAGRPLAWEQPVDATFELRREQGELRLESLKCAVGILEHRRGRHRRTTHGERQLRSQSTVRAARAVCRFEEHASWPAPARPMSTGTSATANSKSLANSEVRAAASRPG